VISSSGGWLPPYAETQAYVKRVTKKYKQTKQAQQAATTAPCYPELIACP